jgi:hypothetical protein
MNSAITTFTVKRILFITLCLTAITFLFYACEKEKDYPVFGAVEIEALSNFSFLAKAEVKDQGDHGIIDYGFIYQVNGYMPDPQSTSGTKLSLGRTIQSNPFSQIIEPDLSQIQYYDDPKLYVKAYMTDGKGTIYSEFAVMPVLKLAAGSIIPSSGTIGDTITILGTGFNENPADNIVTFNNTQGEVVAATANTIQVVVPEGIQVNNWENYIQIVVKSGGMTSQLNSFQLAPSATGYTPSSGSWGDVIRITGSGLQNCSVMLNDVPANLNSRNSNEISFYIPYSFYTKRFKIYLMYDGKKTEVPGGYFKMSDMVLHTYRTKFYPSENLILDGSGYHPDNSNNHLLIGAYSVEASYNYNDLEFEIPLGINEGLYQVRITNKLDTVTLSQEIEIVKPSITSLSINAGYPGKQVQITGTDLSNAYISPYIHMGQYSFSPISVTSSKITFSIPSYITAGEYDLFLEYNQYIQYCPDPFTVLEPFIATIVPSSGVAGTSVIINGEGFQNINYIEVYFGNVKALVMSVSNTQINVKVPGSLTSGSWSIQVYNAGLKVSGTAYFTVE